MYSKNSNKNKIKKIFDGFSLSISMLSIVPFFKVHNFYKGINGYSVMFYPLVGFILGYILIGIYNILENFFTSSHLLVIIFSLWIVLTGALHLDGFSDTVDGLFVDKQKAFTVMKDPNVGSMGMIFSVVFLLLKLSSLMQLKDISILPVILMLSRYGAVIAIYFFNYTPKTGMGYMAKNELKSYHFIFATLYTSVLCYNTFYLAVISVLVIYILAKFFTKRYNGFTGDIYGFCIEITELLLLNIYMVSFGYDI